MIEQLPSFIKQISSTRYLIKLDDVKYRVFTRKLENYSYSTTDAVLATEKIFLLEKPVILYDGNKFYMDKIYPHVNPANGYTIKGKRYGLMCLGNHTINLCKALFRVKKFDALKIKFEDRLTTASTNDAYINYASINYDESLLKVCKICYCMHISSTIICSNCQYYAKTYVGEINENNVNTVNRCKRCGYIKYRFKKCVSHYCE